MRELDPRIVKISIQVNGGVDTFDGSLYLTASGTKFGNALQNSCTATITNLDKATQDYILTATSPFNFNRTNKLLFVDAGRVSYGTQRLYSGTIVRSRPSQPPDIAVSFDCLTGNFQNGNIVKRNQRGVVPLSVIAKDVANDLNLNLDFQATDFSVSNYTYNGSALNQVDKLGNLGNISVYVDDQKVSITNKNVPLIGKTRNLDLDNGMIGIPELTEQGIIVKFLLDNETVVGGNLNVTSQIYPAANGSYTIYRLSYQIASRDTPFYFIAEASRPVSQ